MHCNVIVRAVKLFHKKLGFLRFQKALMILISEVISLIMDKMSENKSTVLSSLNLRALTDRSHLESER